MPAVSHVLWPAAMGVAGPAPGGAPPPPVPAHAPEAGPPLARLVSVQNPIRMPPDFRAEPPRWTEPHCRWACNVRLDTFLHGAGPAVHERIVGRRQRPGASSEAGAAAGASEAATSSRQTFSDGQIRAMANAWMAACLSGHARLEGEASITRTCAVTIQHRVESWLADRLNVQRSGPAPFVVVAVIHTPAPASPLRQRPDAPVSATLLAPHLRDDANVQATVACRAVSLRHLLEGGGIVYACYSAASLDSMSLIERGVYSSTCAAYPDNLIDAPSELPPEIFRAFCGATYWYGASLRSMTGCFAIRMPQAADATQGNARAELFVVSPMDPRFCTILRELRMNFGLRLDFAGAFE
jgi:hypothetical protein